MIFYRFPKRLLTQFTLYERLNTKIVSTIERDFEKYNEFVFIFGTPVYNLQHLVRYQVVDLRGSTEMSKICVN